MTSPLIETKVLSDQDASTRLRSLGLSLAQIQAVVMEGEFARAQATNYDPINAGGTDAYRYRVRAFRELMAPHGWIVDHAGGLEKTWSPNRRHVVITRGGDAGVGCRAGCPQLKRKAGSEIRGIVEGSGLYLDPSWMNVAPVTRRAEEFTTWILLVYRSGDVVRSELSSPIGLRDDDTVLGWYERILLPDVDLTTPATTATMADVEPVEVDVPVVRKR